MNNTLNPTQLRALYQKAELLVYKKSSYRNPNGATVQSLLSRGAFILDDDGFAALTEAGWDYLARHADGGKGLAIEYYESQELTSGVAKKLSALYGM